MKPHDLHPAGRDRRSGFALVLTVTLMVLLSVLAVGMLSLASIEMRKTSAASAKETANSNARMALMMAIGRLQTSAGADQRVTATAGILDKTDPAKSHLTGVWNSGSWDPADGKDKSERFLGWLYSDPTKTTAEPESGDVGSTEKPFTKTDHSEIVRLVGEGSSKIQDDWVSVPTVELAGTSGKATGRFAWWVGDEGVKSSYSTPPVGSDKWNLAGALATHPYPGSGEHPGAKAELPTRAKVLTNETIELAERNEIQGFHDVTARSIGLLTDCRLGGGRVDLSTAFELPLDEFNQLAEFHAAGEKNDTDAYAALSSGYLKPEFYAGSNSPDNGYVCEIPFSDDTNGNYKGKVNNPRGFVRGPTWDLLRNHYRLYKRDWEESDWPRAFPVSDDTYAARGSLPLSYSQTKPGGNVPFPFQYYTSGGSLYSKGSLSNAYSRLVVMNQERGGINGGTTRSMIIPRSPKVAPQAIRLVYAFGLTRHTQPDKSEEESVMISIDPYLVIHNPYNVPLVVPGIGHFISKFNPLITEFEFINKKGKKKTYNTDKFFSQNWYVNGSHTLRLQGPFSIPPGEIRVISPQSHQNGGLQVSKGGLTVLPGQFQYSEQSGIFGGTEGSVQPRPGSSVTVRLRGLASNSTEAQHAIVSMYHPTSHTGAARNIMTHVPKTGGGTQIQADEDIFDDPLLTNISFITNNGRAAGDILIERTVNHSQIPSTSGAGSLYFGALDIRMKPLGDNVPTMMLNYRGEAFDNRDYDSAQRSSVQWDAQVYPIQDISQLQLVTGQDGSGVWGTSYLPAAGESEVTLFEVPQLPLTSLSQFQHAAFEVTGSAQSYPIGNSFPHPGIPQASGSARLAWQRSAPNNGFTVTECQVLADMSWACNESLWDRYFFSGINWGGAASHDLHVDQPYATHKEALEALIEGDRTKPWPLQNPHLDLFDRSGDKDELMDDLLDHRHIADRLAIFGAFNVNSVSKEAWKGLLESVRDVPVQTTNGDSNATTAFSRFQMATGGSGDMFGGFRDLDETEIDRLAEAIVDQVRARGPFLGLADFVNRSLLPKESQGTDIGALGALQAAIEAAGLNPSSVEKEPSAPNIDNTSFRVDGSSASSSTYFGSSQYLTQADVLNTIGPVISARSDSFVVRAYGCALDSKGSRVLAESWCEAVVQRTPEWTSDPDDTEPVIADPDYPDQPGTVGGLHRQYIENPDFPQTDRRFGRKFEIRSFRWLGRDEI